MVLGIYNILAGFFLPFNAGIISMTSFEDIKSKFWVPLTGIEPVTFRLGGGSDSDEQDIIQINFDLDCKT